MKHSLFIAILFTSALSAQNKEGVRLGSLPINPPIQNTVDLSEVFINHQMSSAPPPACDINELTENVAKLYADCIGYVHPDSCKVDDLGIDSRWVVYWQGQPFGSCGRRTTYINPVTDRTCTGQYRQRFVAIATDKVFSVGDTIDMVPR